MSQNRTPRTANASLTLPLRKPWIRPRIDRIDAGQAEVGTRAAADGAFSTS